MRFLMLGPLDVVEGARSVYLGGIKQRATLGFLLLHVNQTVATSDLLNALWPAGSEPLSARKVLQNAIWGLRKALPVGKDLDDQASLLTRSPGYVLCVDPMRVDFFEFRRRADDGREELKAGRFENAASILGEALSLWRGRALADLVEAGLAWPEMVSLQNLRLDAKEDYLEARLSLGEHYAVVGELEQLLEVAPLRERPCGQLMLALYRCGRQADALAVYRRRRTALVEKLGLEPAAELQVLHHAILTQDPALQAWSGLPWNAESSNPRQAPLAIPTQRPRPRTGPPESQRQTGPVAPTKETVVLVAARIGGDRAAADTDGLRCALDRAESVVRGVVSNFQGTMAVSDGAVSVALFALSHRQEHDAVAAVRAAVVLRHRLAEAVAPADADDVRLSVATGEVSLRYRPDGGAPFIAGELPDRCEALLSAAPAGEIRVCDTTRQLTGSLVSYGRGDTSQGWQVAGVHDEPGACTPAGSPELDVLRGLFERVQLRVRPHFATLLGPPNTGRGPLLVEFERWVERRSGTRFIAIWHMPVNDDSVLALPSGIVSVYFGIQRDDSPLAAREKLASRVEELASTAGEAAWLLRRLGMLVDPMAEPSSDVAKDDVLAGWWSLLGKIAGDQGLVLLIDGLHRADDTLLDFVESIPERCGAVPLLVVGLASTELLLRRPTWGGGKTDMTTIIVDGPR